MLALEFSITLTQEKYFSLGAGKDLPKFLDARRRAGLLKITTEFKEAKESALETLAVTLSELPEEPKPVKKAPKKSEQ